MLEVAMMFYLKRVAKILYFIDVKYILITVSNYESY